ncbi:MAG: carboxypeptidase-like regulatory domain-containing protein [Thermoproteota archaeon]
MLYVDRKGWSTMYGIVFDQYDNLYFCDWSSPGNIYYLDFRLSLAYRVLDGNKIPLTGAKVMVTMPNGSALTLSTNSTGYVSLPKAWPGAYRLNVFWQNVSVGLFVFDESASGKRDLACSVFNVKLAARDSSGKALTGCMFKISLPNGTMVEQSSPVFLPSMPTGLMTIQAFYKGVVVAGPIDVNISSNIDLPVDCRVHSLSLSLLDSAGNWLKNSRILVSLNDVLIANQSCPEGSLTLDGLLEGRCVITAILKGVTVAQSDFYLNSTRTIVLKANVSSSSDFSKLVLTVRDFFGLPLQGVRVSLTMPNGSIAKGETDENGVFTLSQIPVGEVNAVLETFFEKKVFNLRLDRDVVEVTQVFNFSWASILVSTILLLLILILLPPTRKRIAKIIPIEVSIGESRDIAMAYLETLYSKGLMVEEAVEIKTGETRILAGEGRILPQVEKTVDHVVIIVSDQFFIPPRREVRILMELGNPEEDVEKVSRLFKHYSESTGLRALGILVCNEADDRLLSLLRNLKDVEVVYTTRRIIGV